MQTVEIIEERLAFSGAGLRLTGVLAYPQADDPVRSILLCSPHPHFAGNMDNNIIAELARHLAKDSVTLRFDYRGIGDSEIKLPQSLSVFDYWDDVEENKSYNNAVDDVASAAAELSRTTSQLQLPLIVIGYSFGVVTGFLYGCNNSTVELMIGIAPPLGKISFDFLAGCQKPCLLLAGKKDFLYSAKDSEKLKGKVNPTTIIEWLDSSDHFFRGEEKRVAERVDKFIRDNM